MTAAPTAVELQELRRRAMQTLTVAVRESGSVLDAVNAMSDYTAARQAYYVAHAKFDDPPLWKSGSNVPG